MAYEEQLVSVAKNEKEQEQNKKSGKKTKKATMSLEEFNNMGTASATIVPLTTEPVDKSRGMHLFSNSLRINKKILLLKTVMI